MDSTLAFYWYVAMSTFLCLTTNTSGRLCPEPDPVPNAYRSMTSLDTGSRVNYTCYHGYRHVVGNLSRECQANGAFDGVPPECQLDCGDPSVEEELETEYNSTLGGTTAVIICSQRWGLNSTLTCDLTSGQWEGTQSDCRDNLPLVDATQSSTYQGMTAELAHIPNDGPGSMTSPEVTPFWQAAFKGSVVNTVIKVSFLLTTNISGLTITLTDAVPGLELCNKVKNLEPGQHRLPCRVQGGMFPAGRGLRLSVPDTGLDTQLGLHTLHPKGRLYSDRCFKPPAIPRLGIVGLDKRLPLTVGSDVQYTCADGFYFFGGHGKSVCSVYKVWSLPTVKCQDRTNHGLAMEVAVYSGRYIETNSKNHVTDDLSDTYLTLTLAATEEKILRLRLAEAIEVDTITVEFSQPPGGGGNLTVEAGVVTSTDNSSSHACAEIDKGHTSGTETTVIQCDVMPVGFAVDVRLRGEINDVMTVSVHEIRVFGRPFGRALECLQTDRGGDYKGSLNLSMSNTPCLPWHSLPAVIHPANHVGDVIADDATTMDDVTRLFPDASIEGASNKCRNPGGLKDGPYCFVSPERVEYCYLYGCDTCLLEPQGATYLGFKVRPDKLPCLTWKDPAIPPARRFLRSEAYSGGRIPSAQACRNPGQSYSQPWCYFTHADGGVAMEACLVPSCPTFISYVNDTAALHSEMWSCRSQWTKGTRFIKVISLEVRAAACLNASSHFRPSFICTNLKEHTVMHVTTNCSVTSSNSSASDVTSLPPSSEPNDSTSPAPLESSSTIQLATSPETTDHSPLSTSMISLSQIPSTSFSPLSLSPASQMLPSMTSSVLTSFAPVTSSSTVTRKVESPRKKNCCVCKLRRQIVNATATVGVLDIQKELTVEVKTLSKSLRKKQSAPDDRTTSAAVGILGISFLVGIFVILVAGDVMTVCIRMASPGAGNRRNDVNTSE